LTFVWKGADSLTLLRAFVSVLVVCAMAGVVLTVLFGFEEANETLLFLSCGLVLAAIVAVFVHLAATRMLNRAQKRLWLHQLTGRRAASALAEYLTCDNLRSAAMRFAEQASSRD